MHNIVLYKGYECVKKASFLINWLEETKKTGREDAHELLLVRWKMDEERGK